MPEVNTGAIQIHYDVAGSGDPVLLMHGARTSSDYWKRAGYVDALAGDHRLVMFDFRGHGASSRPYDAAMYGLIYDVSDALALIEAVGLESVIVCGWSWGATVGLALAALHPERVRSVLAIGASGRHGQFSDVPADFSRFHLSATRIEREGLIGLADDMERMGGQSWMHEIVRGNDPVALAAWYRAQPTAAPLGRALADVKQPVLFVAGELELPLLNFPRPLLPSHARMCVMPGENHVSAFLRVDQIVPALKSVSECR